MPIRPLPDCIPPPDRRYVVSEAPGEVYTFAAMLAVCYSDEVRDAVTSMRVGEIRFFGGGSAAFTSITRVN